MDQLYKCNKCGESAYAEEWNQATLDDLEVFDLGITSIETIRIGNWRDCYYFICPNCGETCYNEDGHISEG